MLAACSSAPKPDPAPLAPLQPQWAVRTAWKASIGNVPFPLAPAVHDGTFTVAAGDGSVVALRAEDGHELWRASVGAPLSAGVGTDGRFTSVVTRDNELVTLEAGTERWRARLASSVSTPPLVAGERVFVLGVDRAVHAFDALDGRRLWSLRRPGEPLTLSASGVVAPFRNTLLVGQGPRLAGVDPLRGDVAWEVPLASPRGTNEVERLADLVGPVLRAGDIVCARAFQAAVGCADAARGTLLWSRNVAGVSAVGGDDEFVFGADGADRITAWRTASGEVAWTSESLRYRGLSAPQTLSRGVVFGDADGLLHVFDRPTGEPLLRLETDGSAIVGRPARAGDTLLVVTRKGGLYAFRPSAP